MVKEIISSLKSEGDRVTGIINQMEDLGIKADARLYSKAVALHTVAKMVQEMGIEGTLFHLSDMLSEDEIERLTLALDGEDSPT